MGEETLDKISKLGEVFTPSYPIELRSFFSGRKEQVKRAFEIIPQKGKHAIIFGDRGVGKTSFSNVLRIVFQESRQVAKINCNSEDTFDTIWRHIFGMLTIKAEEAKQTIGFKSVSEVSEIDIPMSSFLPQSEIDIDFITKLLSAIVNPIIIIDEYDRLDDKCFNKRLFTDCIKAISDNLPHVTLLIVGVSEDVASLINEHESIERNLGQIYMPTMSPEEITEIITKGEGVLSIKFSPSAIEKIIELSSGFPHFTHSLCYYASNSAILQNRADINEFDLQVAIKQTIDQAHESLRNTYRVATLATKANIFSEVLFATSFTPTDEYGYFQANDLEPILSALLEKDVKVNNFVFHLGKFCTPERGEILKVAGSKNRQKYKFRNPLMRAFVRLKIENEQMLEKLTRAH